MHKIVFLTCQFQSINWSLYWGGPNRLSAGETAVINYWRLQGQELVFSHMLFLASKDENTLLHGVYMWWRRKPGWRSGKERHRGEKRGSCWIQLSLSADSICAKILHFHFLFNKAGKSFKEYKLATSQDHKKNERKRQHLLGLEGKQNPLSFKWENSSSKPL